MQGVIYMVYVSQIGYVQKSHYLHFEQSSSN